MVLSSNDFDIRAKEYYILNENLYVLNTKMLTIWVGNIYSHE